MRIEWLNVWHCGTKISVTWFEFYTEIYLSILALIELVFTSSCVIYVRGARVWALWHTAPLIHLLISTLCISFACLHRMLLHLSFFVHFSVENIPTPFLGPML